MNLNVTVRNCKYCELYLFTFIMYRLTVSVDNIILICPLHQHWQTHFMFYIKILLNLNVILDTCLKIPTLQNCPHSHSEMVEICQDTEVYDVKTPQR